ncbi:MAG TPA: hypothetical protein VFI39_04280 [Gemmatimonadales bacterium]|nr:hypothetical protein [Gemmatimonadales bacterium]
MLRTLRVVLAASILTATAALVAAQAPSTYADMQWRTIGPTRAGRARALSGVVGQSNVFYAGFDNGGVWRSTDFGSTWHPIFDRQSTGSVGAIAVAPSDPNVIYVGTGAGIIRPDLSTGDGVYRSTDAGKTWTNVGLTDTRMIAWIAVDPKDPNRVFVAALGHPYGPNAERGIFRSTDGGHTWQKVLYKDEYTSGNQVIIDPADPNVVYASLWRQQQSFREGDEFGGAGNGIYKSTDGGTTWTHLTAGLPDIIEANLGISLSDPSHLYAMVAGVAPAGARDRGDPITGVVGFYTSTDGGGHWVGVDAPGVPSDTSNAADPRPLARIGGGDLPTITVDPKDPKVVYSSSVVLWRTLDGGHTWSAVRGAPGGDDYQDTWIDPDDPNILFVVSDQGAVVSANRGVSWSNWYTQPTAAMYHVTTDNAFPYRVCSGQQDSGSGCVDSRSMDGEITFHDWHPVNIQEYGMAAPDPREPDLVYGSGRTGISLYDRRTGQTTHLGPDQVERGTDFGRNVRTMPLIWSPVDSNALFYASNVVWKSLDHGHSWRRISPDLARATWAVPASAGTYADSVHAGPEGAITALAPSPRDVKVLWAGTDDGNLQVTTDGGATWRNVTPAAIKPWTRIYNLDAGHFDTRTAYAAANTMRIDDPNPHFWRTHDGGRSWTEIDNGLTPGAVANSIREDTRVPGLLYAATETQVWFSIDDGDHWESLRQNMPAVTVRDLGVKDDKSCLCSDLVAATHGRGFWILDDVTPLRQAAQARAAKSAYLFKPEPAMRVRFGTNDPTPWPPELLAGQNPPPGGIIDYYLAADASGPVSLDILDAAGAVVRSYSSDDSVLTPDPGLEPDEYDNACQEHDRTPDCDVPLYWAAPQMRLSTRAGMHRFSWDLRFDPMEKGPGSDNGAAVPHRTYPSTYAPWAPPGTYTIRLTVGGKTYTQSLTLHLDPRVRTPAAGLAELAALTRELYVEARTAHSDALQARALSEALGKAEGQGVAAFRAQLDSLAPAPTGARNAFRGRGRRGGGKAVPTLESASDALLGAAMAMQAADVTPSAEEVAACARARADAAPVMRKWNALVGEGLRTLNARRKGAGLPEISLPGA